mmetsp:Transcript_14578/g.29535  ORF Transcript_14578/g.29535 Transcript_14578/m.29535 type:complete len:255 (-) Transcript_14578:3109-3873(-)
MRVVREDGASALCAHEQSGPRHLLGEPGEPPGVQDQERRVRQHPPGGSATHQCGDVREPRCCHRARCKVGAPGLFLLLHRVGGVHGCLGEKGRFRPAAAHHGATAHRWQGGRWRPAIAAGGAGWGRHQNYVGHGPSHPDGQAGRLGGVAFGGAGIRRPRRQRLQRWRVGGLPGAAGSRQQWRGRVDLRRCLRGVASREGQERFHRQPGFSQGHANVRQEEESIGRRRGRGLPGDGLPISQESPHPGGAEDEQQN